MTLEVRIVDLRIGTWGWTVAGGSFPEESNRRLGVGDREERLDCALDPETP